MSAAPARVRHTAGSRREEILDAAVVEFAATGLHGTATETIARRAGVSQPYVFRLFGTKKALFLAALRRVHDRTHELFASALEAARAEGADPFDAMGLRYLEQLADRDWLLLQMQGYAACGDGDVRDAMRAGYGDLVRLIESVPGASRSLVHGFLSTGMFLNVAAALDLLAVAATEDWAARCLDIPLPSGADCPPGLAPPATRPGGDAA